MKQLLIVFLLCFSTSIVYGQTFRGGLVLGANFTQIDGDAIAGYTKLGANAGFISEIPLTDNWIIGFEILYSQKGSATRSAFISPSGVVGNRFKINWDYAEIPVLIKYRDTQGGLTFGLGLSFNRLVRNRYIEDGLDLTDSYFSNSPPKNLDINGMVEMSYMFSDFFGLNLRGAYSVFSQRQDLANSRFRNAGQFNNVVSLRTIFLFSALFNKEPGD